MMKRSIIILSAIVVAATIISGIATMSTSIGKVGEAATDNGCLPKTLNSVAVGFPIRQPAASSMPAGFNLEGVDSAGGAVILFYADHSLCPSTESFDGLIEKGAIVVTVNRMDTVNDSMGFQNEQLAYYANHTETIAKVQPITINGNKGIGWEPFTGTDTVTLDGKVIRQEPVKMPGGVTFYDDKDGTVYAIRAHRSLQELVKIAESLHSPL
ncbi:MAG: hypothetical protein C4292_01805 [Nitrososphaera sp.]